METLCENGIPRKKSLNVYEQAQIRLEKIFNTFDNVYVSFSGGKDSGMLLHLCIDYIRKHCPGRKLGVFHMDYEVQYGETIRYVDQVLASNSDVLEVYRVCVPFKVSTCTSMFERFWRPWDEEKKSVGYAICLTAVIPGKIFLFLAGVCGIMNFNGGLPVGCICGKRPSVLAAL